MSGSHPDHFKIEPEEEGKAIKIDLVQAAWGIYRQNIPAGWLEGDYYLPRRVNEYQCFKRIIKKFGRAWS